MSKRPTDIPWESPFATVSPRAMKAPINPCDLPTIDVRELTDYQLRAIIGRATREQERRAEREAVTIHFDMDGTLADLYGVPNWLPYLENHDPYPYANAIPLLNLSALARKLNALQRQGYRLSIVSWLSKTSTAKYDRDVTNAKRKWLAQHLPSVHWDEVNIVPYGTPKEQFCSNPADVLFDDEERNRLSWTGKAFDIQNILEVLSSL